MAAVLGWMRRSPTSREKHAGPPQVFLTPSGGLARSDGSGGALMEETLGLIPSFLDPHGGWVQPGPGALKHRPNKNRMGLIARAHAVIADKNLVGAQGFEPRTY